MTADAQKWHNRAQRFLLTVVLVGAAVISFTSIAHLAQRWGFGALSWAFPVILDAAGAYGMAVWLRHQTAWRAGAVLTLVSVGFSTAVNVTDHYQATRSSTAALLGALPPAMLALVLFVAHRNTRAPGTRRWSPFGGGKQRRPVPATEPNPVPDPRPAPRKPSVPAGPVPDAVLVETVRGRIQSGDHITKTVLMEEYRIGSTKALNTLRAARNGAHEEVPA